MQVNKKRGILIIAAGHPYYGKMAAALAATIKCKSTVSIHLAYAGSALKYLSGAELALFGSMAPIPGQFYTFNGQQRFIKAKMYLYELSPFLETIFLDADMAMVKDPLPLFDELKEYDITFSNHGSDGTQSIWADIEKVKETYQVQQEKFYSLHSEFIFFKKTKVARKFFTTAQHLYEKLKVPATTFAGAIPDELPPILACMLTKLYPHKDYYRPVFWQNSEKRMLHIYEIAREYYGYSMGSHTSPRHSISLYNTSVSAAYRKLGLQHAYTWKQKKSFLPERKNI